LLRPSTRCEGEEVERIPMPTTAQEPLTYVDRPDLRPLCPHCEQEITTVFRKGRGVPFGQGRTIVYFCPRCLKVIGFAQGRMV
jgi:hypothetical protein